jgi:pimeloyl-ACP methyl ester carboxylesterase
MHDPRMNEKTHNDARIARTLGFLGRWGKRLVLGFVGLLLLLAISGLIYQTIASAVDARRFPPPGKLVDVGGYRMHIHVTGQGNPTVVLDAGAGATSLDWFAVQPEVSKFTQVCSYDRPGLGWSDASPLSRTSKEMVRELHTVLLKAGISGPFVLVGHSFGGFNVQLFAHEYPGETAGIVLVDSSHEDFEAKAPASFVIKRSDLQMIQRGRMLCPFGIVRLFFVKPNKKFPKALQPLGVALQSRAEWVKTCYNEMSCFEDSGAQVRASLPLAQVPLAVVSAGHEGEKPNSHTSFEDFSKFVVLWRDLQADLVTRCTNSIHLTATNSGHLVPYDAPSVVVDAIRRVVEAVRDKAPLTPAKLGVKTSL